MMDYLTQRTSWILNFHQKTSKWIACAVHLALNLTMNQICRTQLKRKKLLKRKLKMLMQNYSWLKTRMTLLKSEKAQNSSKWMNLSVTRAFLKKFSVWHQMITWTWSSNHSTLQTESVTTEISVRLVIFPNVIIPHGLSSMTSFKNKSNKCLL